MKIGIWVALFLLFAIPAGMFLYQRWRQKVAESTGVVVYATVIALEPVTVFGKPSEMVKLTLWLQEPDKERREVSLRTRVPAGQKIEAGTKICVVIDKNNPKKIYPASEAAMKRVVLTGARAERRMMKSGRGVGMQRPQGGYQPPRTGGRRG